MNSSAAALMALRAFVSFFLSSIMHDGILLVTCMLFLFLCQLSVLSYCSTRTKIFTKKIMMITSCYFLYLLTAAVNFRVQQQYMGDQQVACHYKIRQTNWHQYRFHSNWWC